MRLLLLLLVAAFSPVADARQSTAPTPARRQALRLPDMPLHDPFVVADRATGTYWLFTRNERQMTGDVRVGVMAYTSRDLNHWTRPRIVLALSPDTWANDGAWAPEVHRWRGRWYLFATFHNEKAALPATHGRPSYRRATVLAVADRLGGPFTLVRQGAPVAEADRMTLDGTLYVDEAGKPWLVYAHEWIQVGTGTMEARPLDTALRGAGPSRTLFRATDAPWASGARQPDGTTTYVTDGPQLYRSSTGTLLMLWSSYDRDGYVQSIARSQSGKLAGPWTQLPPLVRADSGHGMLFRRFDGQLMMVLHRPFRNARGKLYEMRDDGDTVTVVREATELDGEARDIR